MAGRRGANARMMRLAASLLQAMISRSSGDGRRARAAGIPDRRSNEEGACQPAAVDRDETRLRVHVRLREGRERAGDICDDGVEVVVVPETGDPRRVRRVCAGHGNEAHEEQQKEHGQAAPCGDHTTWWAQANPSSSRASYLVNQVAES